MQGIDALGYEEVMTFLRSTPANLFFKDTECRYLFVSDVRTFFPYGEGQEEDVLGKTDLEIWSSEEQARFYEAEQLIERLHGELARQSDDRLKLDVAFGYHTVTEGPFDYTAVYHAADRDMYRNKRKNR